MLDLLALVLREQLPDRAVVPPEQGTPGVVAQELDVSSGIDDVGEGKGPRRPDLHSLDIGVSSSVMRRRAVGVAGSSDALERPERGLQAQPGLGAVTVRHCGTREPDASPCRLAWRLQFAPELPGFLELVPRAASRPSATASSPRASAAAAACKLLPSGSTMVSSASMAARAVSTFPVASAAVTSTGSTNGWSALRHPRSPARNGSSVRRAPSASPRASIALANPGCGSCPRSRASRNAASAPSRSPRRRRASPSSWYPQSLHVGDPLQLAAGLLGVVLGAREVPGDANQLGTVDPADAGIRADRLLLAPALGGVGPLPRSTEVTDVAADPDREAVHGAGRELIDRTAGGKGHRLVDPLASESELAVVAVEQREVPERKRLDTPFPRATADLQSLLEMPAGGGLVGLVSGKAEELGQPAVDPALRQILEQSAKSRKACPVATAISWRIPCCKASSRTTRASPSRSPASE